MTWQDAINLLAIVLGPVFAVLVSLWHQGKTEANRRKMEVFRALMKTRRRKLDPEHVSALNLVEIEFYKDRAIREAMKALMEIFGRVAPPANDPSAEAFWDKFGHDHDERFVILLDKMAKHLGYDYEQIEILKGGYNPQYFSDVEKDINKGRRLLAQLYDLSAGRGLPIDVVDYRTVEQLKEAAAAADRKMRGIQAS